MGTRSGNFVGSVNALDLNLDLNHSQHGGELPNEVFIGSTLLGPVQGVLVVDHCRKYSKEYIV